MFSLPLVKSSFQRSIMQDATQPLLIPFSNYLFLQVIIHSHLHVCRCRPFSQGREDLRQTRVKRTTCVHKIIPPGLCMAERQAEAQTCCAWSCASDIPTWEQRELPPGPQVTNPAAENKSRQSVSASGPHVPRFHGFLLY